MSPEYRNTFCSVCTHRSSSILKGRTCGLTQENPDFESNCEDFDFDGDELKSIKEKNQKRIENNYVKKSWQDYPECMGVYKSVTLNKYVGVPREKSYGNQKAAGWLGLLLSTTFIYPIFAAKEIDLVGVLFFGICGGIFGLLSIKNLLNREIYFSWNKDYLFLKNRKVYYRDILDVGRAMKHRPGKDAVVLSTITSGIIEFDVLDLEISVPRILGIINKYGAQQRIYSMPFPRNQNSVREKY